MTTAIETYGTIRPDGTLDLEQKFPYMPGRVKVRVERAEVAAKPQETMLEFVQRSRVELEAAGHQFMNDEEVTAWIDELRDDDDRIEEAYRQAEQEKQAGNVTP